MSARRPLRFVFVCVVALSVLTGCVTALAPTRPLFNDGDRIANEVATAVQANGIKHYVWAECSTAGGCQLVYRRVLTGTTLYQHTFRVASTAQITNPDVAVTADGRAFVVRSVCDDRICTDYYSIIPANANDTTVIDSQQLALTIANSAGPPRIESRDNVVYAAYLVETPGNSRLRYRQLSGGTSGGYIDIRAEARPSDPSLAIGNNGALYVTWKATYSGTSEVLYSSNLGTSGDFNGPISYDPFGNYSFHNPDIALDPSNTPYIVYAYDGDTSDTVKIVCQTTDPSDCFGGVAYRTIPLNNMQMYRNPHIQVLGTSPAVVFSGDNSTTDNNEIWYYTPPNSGVDPGPTRATTNNVQDGEPLIVVERSNYGDVPVVAWRTYVTVTVPPNPPLPGVAYDCVRDAYVFYFNNMTTRRVFESTSGCYYESQDLAANGPWVAGIWIAPETNTSSRYIPWTTFNANTTYAPVTAK